MSDPCSALAFEMERELDRAGCPVVVTLHEAARIAAKSRETVARYVRAGLLPATRTAAPSGRIGHWRIRRSDLARWLAGAEPRIEREGSRHAAV